MLEKEKGTYNVEVFKLFPQFIALLLGVTYILGFVRSQASYIKDFGILPFSNETYIYNGFYPTYFILVSLAIIFVTINDHMESNKDKNFKRAKFVFFLFLLYYGFYFLLLYLSEINYNTWVCMAIIGIGFIILAILTYSMIYNIYLINYFAKSAKVVLDSQINEINELTTSIREDLKSFEQGPNTQDIKLLIEIKNQKSSIEERLDRAEKKVGSIKKLHWLRKTRSFNIVYLVALLMIFMSTFQLIFAFTEIEERIISKNLVQYEVYLTNDHDLVLSKDNTKVSGSSKVLLDVILSSNDNIYGYIKDEDGEKAIVINKRYVTKLIRK